MSMTRRARELYPLSRRLAAKWVIAAKWLRARGLWIHDEGTPTPKWGNQARAE